MYYFNLYYPASPVYVVNFSRKIYHKLGGINSHYHFFCALPPKVARLEKNDVLIEEV
jgi:hypothetical protein